MIVSRSTYCAAPVASGSSAGNSRGAVLRTGEPRAPGSSHSTGRLLQRGARVAMWCFGAAMTLAFDALFAERAFATLRVASIGDFGETGEDELAVANLVKSLDPDIIITMGDNSYSDFNIDDNVGQYYSDFIGAYVGAYGSGSLDGNRFFPSLGNHDYSDGDGVEAYLDYFTLPGLGIESSNTSGNERYYDFVYGPVHFFAVNSCGPEPDDNDAGSIQAQWLQAQLAASTKPWKIVYFHHAAYSSGEKHGNNEYMQWPFKEWGASAVLAGHDHVYERLIVDGLPYFVNGLGGRSIRDFSSSPEPGSMARYADDFGAMILTAEELTLRFEFFSINPADSLVDSYTIFREIPDVEVTPSLIDFGDGYINTVTFEDLELQNAGYGQLEVANMLIEGPDAADFAVVRASQPPSGRGSGVGVASTAVYVAPGASKTLSIRFAPTTLGAKHAVLRVMSNDPNEATLDVQLNAMALPTPAPKIVAVPDTLDYDEVQMTTTETRSTWVWNAGNKPLQIDSIGLAGADKSEFVVLTGTGAHTLAAGDSVHVVVQCTPATEGQKDAKIVMTSNDPELPVVTLPLLAMVVPPSPDIVVSPVVLDFDSTMATVPRSRALQIRSSGLLELELTSTRIVGTNAAAYAITSGGESATVVPGDSTALVVTFDPSTEGLMNAALRIESNDPNENPLDVPLVGFALPPPTPDIEVDVSVLDLGEVALTTTPATRLLDVHNLGTGALVLTDVRVIGTDKGDFSAADPVTSTLLPGATTQLQVEFDPSSVGSKTATLRIESDDPDENPTEVQLRGQALPPPAPIIEVVISVDYGGVLIDGGSATQRIDVYNHGNADLVFDAVTVQGADASDFSILGGPISSPVVPGDSTWIEVSFAPQTAGAKAATLRIESNDPDDDPRDVALAGFGIDASGTPSAVIFQESIAGESSNSSTVTTSGNLSASDGHLYLAAIGSKNHRTVTDVHGLDLDWTPLVEQCSGRDQTGVQVWMARGSPSSGAVTASFDGSTESGVLIVSRYSGVHPDTPIGNIASANTNGVAASCSGGNDNNAFEVELDTTVDGALVYGVVAMRNRSFNASNGYTERGESRSGSGGKAASIATADQIFDQASTVLFDGSFTGQVDWAAAAIEVRSDLYFNEIDVAPAAFHFGTIDAGQSSDADFEIRNTGAADLQILSVSLLGIHAHDFVITAGGGAATLPPGTSQSVSVRFAPQSSGSKSATLRIVNNDDDETMSDIPLTGIALPLLPDVAVAPLSLDFGNVFVDSSATLATRIRNHGNGDLHVTALTLSGAHPADFSIHTGSAPFTLTPGDSADVVVSCTPTAPGTRTAALQIASNDPDEPAVDVALSTTAATYVEAEISAAPTLLDFGSVPAATRDTLAVMVSNLGIDELQVGGATVTGADSLEFQVSNGGAPFAVAPGDSTALHVMFAPQTEGGKSATLQLSSNDPNQPHVDVSLAGFAAPPLQPDLVVVPMAHDFGDVQTFASMTFEIQVRNEGEARLDVVVTSVSGPDSLDFAVTNGGAPFSVAVGDSADVSVTFTASTDGPKSAALQIQSNDPDETVTSVALAGNAFTPPPGAVSFEESASGDESSGAVVETDASLSAVDGDLYVVAVATKGYRATTAVTGMGLTWTLVKAQCGAREQTGVDVWMGTGTPSAGTISATLEASTSKAVIIASRYSGVDPGDAFGTIMASNTKGVNGACSGGNDGDAFSYELQTNVHDAFVFVAVAGRHRNLTPGNAFFLRDDARIGSDGTVASVSILDQQFDTPTTATVDGTFDGDVDWAVVSIEFKPGVGATKQARSALPVRKPGLALRNGVGGIAPWIELASPQPTLAHVRVFDVRGRLVDTVWSGRTPAGRSRLEWSGVDRYGRLLPAGIYLVRAEIGARVFTGKLIILR